MDEKRRTPLTGHQSIIGLIHTNIPQEGLKNVHRFGIGGFVPTPAMLVNLNHQSFHTMQTLLQETSEKNALKMAY